MCTMETAEGRLRGLNNLEEGCNFVLMQSVKS